MSNRKNGDIAYGTADLTGFNAIEARDGLVAGIRNAVRKAGFERVVIGISGGKDSTVTAALCVRALGRDNVIGVLMPDGIQSDISDSERVVEVLGIRYLTVNICKAHNAITGYATGLLDEVTGGSVDAERILESDINVAPRLRMTLLRYVGQAMGALLAGTGNASEIAVGYFTKDGDSSCDIAVLAGLTSVEVVEVGRTMPEIPTGLVTKTPTDGLSGKPDEERLGVSYVDIHNWIRHGTSGNDEVDDRIATLHARSEHKRHVPSPIWRGRDSR